MASLPDGITLDIPDLRVTITPRSDYVVKIQPVDEYHVVTFDTPTITRATSVFVDYAQSASYANSAGSAVSSSYATTASYVSGAASTWDDISGKPDGLVSSSTQITITESQISDLTPHYTDSDTLDYINTVGVFSSSAQVDYDSIQNVPSGLVSSSSQINTGSFSGLFDGTFVGDGSGLTGVTAIGTGVDIRDDGSILGAVQIIDFVDGIDATVTDSTASISLNRTGSFSGSFTGDGSGLTDVVSSETASYVNPLNQYMIISGALLVSSSDGGPTGDGILELYGGYSQLKIWDDEPFLTRLGTAFNSQFVIHADANSQITNPVLRMGVQDKSYTLVLNNAGQIVVGHTTPSGSALPSIAHWNDTDTGIWFPSNDTVEFVTNATKKLTIDSVGDVFIHSGSLTTVGDITASAFIGDGSQVTGVVSSSYAVTASYVSGAAATWDDISGKPSGLVSSSVQINTGSFTGSFNGSFSNIISSGSSPTPSENYLWYDDTTGKTYIYYVSASVGQWVLQSDPTYEPAPTLQDLQDITDLGNTTTNKIIITNTTSATSISTGALIVSGGLGISGSVHAISFVGDGSQIQNVTATGVTANSVTLATDTTGDFVNSITAGTGISSTGATSGENISHTLSIDLTEITVGSGLTVADATTLNLDISEVIATDGVNRILTSDADGTLTAEPNFIFDGSELGISGNIDASGNITASAFNGDGTQITGIVSSSYAVTASYAENAGSNDWNDITNIPSGLVSSSVQINTGSFSGSFSGDGSGLTGVTGVGSGVEIRDDGAIQGTAQILDFVDGIDATFASSTASISLNRTGSFTGSFSGDGSGLTGVVSSSYAVTASYVDGASITGVVSSETASYVNPLVQDVKITGSIYLTGSDGIYVGPLTNIKESAGGVSFGTSNLNANTTGYGNIAIGRYALQNNTTGFYNTALGLNALRYNTTGGFNVAIGINALYDNTKGNNNIAIGRDANYNSTIGNDNTVVGHQALLNNVSGSNNTAIGSQTLTNLANINTVSANTVVGWNSGGGIVTGSYNTILGANVTGLPTELSNTIIISDGDGNYGLYISSSRNAQFYGDVVTSGDVTASAFIGDGSQVTGVVSSSYAVTASYVDGASITGVVSSETASYVNPLTQSVNIDGDLTVTGILTAQEFHTEFVSSSIIYESGSTKFGDTLDDIHEFTGSLYVSGGVDILQTSTYGIDLYRPDNRSTIRIDTDAGKSTTVNFSQGGVAQYYVGMPVQDVSGLGNRFAVSYKGTPSFVIDNNSRVSLNNTSMTSRLAVSGSDSEPLLHTYSNFAPNAFFVSGSGNVGIGTITPSDKLHVQGNITASSVTSSNDSLINSLTAGRGGGNISTNTTVGYQSLLNNTTGANNVSIGYQSLQNNTDGFNNIAIGSSALRNGNGSYNTAIGVAALQNWDCENNINAYNTAIGYAAMQNASGSSSGNVALGANTLKRITGSYGIAIGYNSQVSNTTGVNISVGAFALDSNTTGTANTAVGLNSLTANVIGNNNTAIGDFTLYRNVSGSRNVAVSYTALFNSMGNNNTAIGYQALYDLADLTTHSNNTVLGYNSGRGIVTGSYNTILGANVTGLPSELSNTIIIADGQGNYGLYVSSSRNAQFYGDVVTSGDVTASGFYGDGSQITGVVSSSYALSSSYSSTAGFATDVMAIYTASITDDTIAFLKGGGGTFQLTVDNVSSSSYAETSSYSNTSEWSGLNNIPSGLVSSSTQITITESQISDLTHYTDTDTLDYINTVGVFSSSAQVNADTVTNFDSNVLTYINSLGAISSSTQVDYDSIQNVPSGIVSASSFTSPSQGTVRATINGVQTDVDTGLQTGDSPQFTNLTLSGNLTVNGTTTYISSSQVDIGDQIITLNANNASGDGGIYVNDTSTNETGSLLWDVSENYWIAGLLGSESEVITLSSLNAKGVFSSSAQVNADSVTNFDSNVLTYINSLGAISSSSQITITESQISDLTHYTDTDTLDYINSVGVFSSSAQVDYGTIQNVPSGIVSSSTQFTTLSAPFTGSFTGSFTGDGSQVTGVVSASYASTGGSGLVTKAGSIANTSFTGNPRTATVTFSTAFGDTNYAVVVTGEDSRAWTIQSKGTSGFTVNSNAAQALSGNTYWTATAYGETQ